MRPGGRFEFWWLLAVLTGSSIAVTSTAAGGELSCGQRAPQVLSFDDAARALASGCIAPGDGVLEVKAEASDGGAYWFGADDPSAAARISLSADPELSRTITFRAPHLVTPLGEVEVHGGVGRVDTSDAVTFERLQWADPYLEDSAAIGIGAVEKLLGGRLTIGTDLSWSSSTSELRDETATPIEFLSRGGAARWNKIDAKIFDDPDFKWSITGEVSTVDKGYRGNPAAHPVGVVPLAGERNNWRTKLSVSGVDALVSLEHFAGTFFARDATRAELDFEGIDATVYRKELQRRSPLDPAQWTSRKDVSGATVDLIPRLLMPGFASNTPLVPQLVSTTFEAGRIDYPAGLDAVEGVTSVEALVQWKTALGDTTATYTRERQGRNDPVVGFSGESDQLIDVSHVVKFGDWRFGAGVSWIALGNTSVDDGFADSSVSGTFSIRYMPAHGPKFSASLGHNEDDFALDGLDFSSLSRATTLDVSLDLTDFVQDQLDRRDTSLSLQYRHQLRDTATSFDALAPAEVARNADTLLVSFRTPL